MRRLILGALALLFVAVPLSAQQIEYRAVMTGAQEVPSADTGAVARASVAINVGFTRINVQIRPQRLEGNFAALHFHCARAGENGPLALGIIQPGNLEFDGEKVAGTLRNADFPAEDACVGLTGYPINNVASFAAAIEAGLIYLNLHTDVFPAGEVRGQLVPASK